jgi:putative FmdB family regulatory protein
VTGATDSRPPTPGTYRWKDPLVLEGVRVVAIYEFDCRKCGTRFEVTCHMDEREAQAVCPKCGSHKVGQQYTAAFSSPPPDKY